MFIMLKCLIDTNILLIGASDVDENEDSDEAKIIKLLIEGKIRPIVTIQLLNEYHEAAKRLMDKDFAGWLRYLIVDVSKPIFIPDDVCKELEPKFASLIPKEDLRHFVCCVVAEADYLISNNGEFLKKSKNDIFRCVTPKEFLSKEEFK